MKTKSAIEQLREMREQMTNNKIEKMEPALFTEKLALLLQPPSGNLVKATCTIEVDGQYYIVKGFVIKQEIQVDGEHLNQSKRLIGDFTLTGEIEIL